MSLTESQAGENSQTSDPKHTIDSSADSSSNFPSTAVTLLLSFTSFRVSVIFDKNVSKTTSGSLWWHDITTQAGHDSPTKIFWEHPSFEQCSKGHMKISCACTDDSLCVCVCLLDNLFLNLLQKILKGSAHSQNKRVFLRFCSPHTADIDCDLIPRALLCIRSKERTSQNLTWPFPGYRCALGFLLLNTRDGRRPIYIVHTEQSCHLQDACRKWKEYSATKISAQSESKFGFHWLCIVGRKKTDRSPILKSQELPSSNSIFPTSPHNSDTWVTMFRNMAREPFQALIEPENLSMLIALLLRWCRRFVFEISAPNHNLNIPCEAWFAILRAKVW